MIIIKRFYTRLDLFDPKEIYNINNILLDKLNSKFVNKCYSGDILILEIIKIVNKSNFIFHLNTINASGYIDVELEVSGLSYGKDEIIPDCKIENILPDGIIASNKYIKTIFKNNENIEYQALYKLLKKDMKIPIIVENASYPINSNNIIIKSSPLIPKYEKLTMYNCNTDLNTEQLKTIKLFLNTILQEEETHKNLYKNNKKSYDLFKLILYNYKSDQKFQEHKIIKDFKLKPVEFTYESLSKLTTGVIVYSDLDNRINRRLFYSSEQVNEEKIVNSEILVVNNSLFSNLMLILFKYYKYLLSLRGLVDSYDLEQINHLVEYFKVYNKLKK